MISVLFISCIKGELVAVVAWSRGPNDHLLISEQPRLHTGACKPLGYVPKRGQMGLGKYYLLLTLTVLHIDFCLFYFVLHFLISSHLAV